jgi:hypothetical protein
MINANSDVETTLNPSLPILTDKNLEKEYESQIKEMNQYSKNLLLN